MRKKDLKEKVIEEMMYNDAEPALRKLKSGKTRLHRLEQVEP